MPRPRKRSLLLQSLPLAGTFLALIVVAVVLSKVERYSWITPRACRLLGYPAMAAMIVPYLYVARRWYIRRYYGNMTGWILWHIAASYLALALTLVHGQGRAGQPLTFWLMCMFWTVMASGVVGVLVQRISYRLMALMVDREIGLERLDSERQRLSARAHELIENPALLASDDISWEPFCATLCTEGHAASSNGAWKSEVRQTLWELLPEKARDLTRSARLSGQVQVAAREQIVSALNEILKEGKKFYRAAQLVAAELPPEGQELLQIKKRSDEQAQRLDRLVLDSLFPGQIAASRPRPAVANRFFKSVDRYLQAGFPNWWWLFTPWAFELVPKNHYLRALQLVEPAQQGVIHELWRMVEQRRRINIEYWLHRLANLWLVVHGPAAWGLLVLLAAHVLSSIWYGGL